MRRFRKKVRRFVRLYWFWVSLGLVLTKVSVEAAYIERGYKAYGGEWLVLPVVMIVGYFVNEARMYLPDFIEEWREEKAYERRVAEIVDEYREKEIHISDEEAEQILWLCNRKMDICKIENREEYLPLLFKDEVKNYLFRCSVNATTF